MICLGIDPGTATTGYGVIEAVGTRRLHLLHGVIRTPYGLPQGERLMILHEKLCTLVERFTPSLIGMEKLFFSTNVKTAISVAQAQGVVLFTAAAAGIPVIELTPNQVKMSVTQNGNADKRQVQLMVRRLLQLADIPRPDDAADALAVALSASQEPAWRR
ncbi:MAG: crossover junction endodeoxyribonuclease RuvC [Candidatus Hydrogenedentota bacterium]|nr:MAG: crossover junction endodeoxyribonuclease RuvC [Candidatus Hydrogenedentota bacterium]